MNSRTTADFRACLKALPPEIIERARKAYDLFEQNPRHPSVRFKKIHAKDPIYSARVTRDYRAVGVMWPETASEDPDSTVVWFGSALTRTSTRCFDADQFTTLSVVVSVTT